MSVRNVAGRTPPRVAPSTFSRMFSFMSTTPRSHALSSCSSSISRLKLWLSYVWTSMHSFMTSSEACYNLVWPQACYNFVFISSVSDGFRRLLPKNPNSSLFGSRKCPLMRLSRLCARTPSLRVIATGFSLFKECATKNGF